MVVHARKDKWDAFARKVEDLQAEVEAEKKQEEELPRSSKKTPSE